MIILTFFDYYESKQAKFFVNENDSGYDKKLSLEWSFSVREMIVKTLFWDISRSWCNGLVFEPMVGSNLTHNSMASLTERQELLSYF